MRLDPAHLAHLAAAFDALWRGVFAPALLAWASITGLWLLHTYHTGDQS